MCVVRTPSPWEQLYTWSQRHYHTHVGAERTHTHTHTDPCARSGKRPLPQWTRSVRRARTYTKTHTDDVAGARRHTCWRASLHAHTLSEAANSYGTAFWWAVGLTVLAIPPSIVLMHAERRARRLAATPDVPEEAMKEAMAS